MFILLFRRLFKAHYDILFNRLIMIIIIKNILRSNVQIQLIPITYENGDTLAMKTKRFAIIYKNDAFALRQLFIYY